MRRATHCLLPLLLVLCNCAPEVVTGGDGPAAPAAACVNPRVADAPLFAPAQQAYSEHATSLLSSGDLAICERLPSPGPVVAEVGEWEGYTFLLRRYPQGEPSEETYFYDATGQLVAIFTGACWYGTRFPSWTSRAGSLRICSKT